MRPVLAFISSGLFSWALTQECTHANAVAIDDRLAESQWAAFWLFASVGWLLIWKRSDTFTCSSNEQCLSLRGYIFCYDQSTEIFRTALGTTGSAATGDYQLADGRQGNLYHGPYPKPTDTDTGAGTVTVEATSAAPTGSTDDTVTISTPTAGPKTVTVQASSAATPDSNNDATTSVAPKTVTVGQDTGGQVPTSANTPLGASTTAKTGSVNGSNGQSVAREGIFTKGAKLAIVLTVASILMRLI